MLDANVYAPPMICDDEVAKAQKMINDFLRGVDDA